MITIGELETIAQVRLEDAEALIVAGRYDGAIYIGGYAIELSLKARICKTLNWQDFPETQDYRSFKVHNLDVLLHLSGMEDEIKKNHLNDWSIVRVWNPESRYKIAASASTQEDAETTIESIKELMGVL